MKAAVFVPPFSIDEKLILKLRSGVRLNRDLFPVVRIVILVF